MENIDLRNKIKSEIVEPSYYEDVKNNLEYRKLWKIISDILELMSKLLIIAATVIAFYAGYSTDTIFALMAACFNFAALIMWQFSTYSLNVSIDKGLLVNRILSKLGITEIVDITLDTSLLQSDLEIVN